MKPKFAAVLAMVLSIAGQNTYVRGEIPSTNQPFSSSKLGIGALSAWCGKGLGVSATPSGALLHCEFQKVDGDVTCEGLWLTSTAGANRERFQVRATGT